MRIMIFMLLIIPAPAIPETAGDVWARLDMEMSGEICTTSTDIQEYGGGDLAACLINARELNDIKFPPRWHWKNRPKTVFDQGGQ